MSDAYDRAWAAFDIGRYDLCERFVLDGLRDDPNDVDLIVLLGELRLIEGRSDHVRALGQDAIRLDPEDARGFALLAWGTITDFTYAPSNRKYHWGTDNAKIAATDRTDTARRLAHRCLEIDPQSATYFALLAEVEFLDDRPIEALSAAENGLSCDPTNASCAHARVGALRLLRRLGEAIDMGRQRLRLSPEDPRSHHALAELYLEMGDVSSAIRHARQAVRLKPEKSEYRQTYWDVVKAKNPIFRPLVQWQFVARRFASLSDRSRIFLWCLTPVVVFLSAGLAGITFTQPNAPMLVATMVTAGLLFLVSERPCMSLVDLAIYATDREYRRSVDRQQMTLSATLTLAAIFMMACLLLSLYSVVWPLAVTVALAFFSIPMLCFLHSHEITWKIVMLLSVAAMAGFLWYVVTTYRGSQPNSAERMQSIYGVIGFIFMGLAAPIAYGLVNRRPRSIG